MTSKLILSLTTLGLLVVALVAVGTPLVYFRIFTVEEVWSIAWLVGLSVIGGTFISRNYWNPPYFSSCQKKVIVK